MLPNYTQSGRKGDAEHQTQRRNQCDGNAASVISWFEGGDYNPADRDLGRAIAEAIYTYGAVFSAVVEEYARGESWPWRSLGYDEGRLWRLWRHTPAPLFLIESVYENTYNGTVRHLRTDAYNAVLSGAAGQVFGNNPMWHFDGPGLYPAPRTKVPSANVSNN